MASARFPLFWMTVVGFLLCSNLKLAAQSVPRINISGTVTDTTGIKIPGATVAIIGDRSSGAITDANGKFYLSVLPGAVIRISFISYTTQTITVTDAAKPYNVILVPVTTEATEVVVTAYGRKQRKEAVVGSVTSIKPESLKIPASNLTNALAGQVAGVIAYQSSGQPGQDNATFFIRGVTTFGYKQDPLILIDNVELTSSDLARLNVDDIEEEIQIKE